MKSDTWLVEYVEHVDELRANLSGKTDSLALSTRKGSALSIERQIVETHFEQEVDPCGQFFQNLASYLALSFRNMLRQRHEPFLQRYEVEVGNFGYVAVPKFVSQRLLFQSHAVTFRTFRHRQELVSPFLSGCALVVFYYRLQIFYHAIIIGEIIRRRVNLLFRNSHLLHAAKHDVVDGLGWNILERSF